VSLAVSPDTVLLPSQRSAVRIIAMNVELHEIAEAARSACPHQPNCPQFILSKEGVDAVLQGAPVHCVSAKLRALPVNGAPNGVLTPPGPGIPVPVVWHGVVLPDVETGAD
jgi:hypothetical protein